jgi:uncharacterized membrane protein
MSNPQDKTQGKTQDGTVVVPKNAPTVSKPAPVSQPAQQSQPAQSGSGVGSSSGTASGYDVGRSSGTATGGGAASAGAAPQGGTGPAFQQLLRAADGGTVYDEDLSLPQSEREIGSPPSDEKI